MPTQTKSRIAKEVPAPAHPAGAGLDFALFDSTSSHLAFSLGQGMEALNRELNGRGRLALVDVGANQERVKRENVHTLPTLVVYRDGQEVDRLIGCRNPLELNSWIVARAARG